jgi:hypothetical protein
MKKIIIIAAIFLLTISCSEENSMFDPTYFGDSFKGITFTGEDDPTPFKGDPTDWCSFVPYGLTKIEGKLKVDDEDPIVPMSYSFGAAYPNPVNVSGTFNIPFALPKSTHVYIYIINKDYKIIKVLLNELKSAGTYLISIHSSSIGPAGVYRVVFESEGIYCKGDIWIKGSFKYH